MVHEITKVFQWQTREHDDHARGKIWYWVVGILAAGFVALAIFFKNYILVALVVIAAATLLLQIRHKPDEIAVGVSEQGIKVGPAMYNFRDLDAFWLAMHENGETHLLLHSDRAAMPIYSVPVGDDIDLMDLRDYLGVFLEEREMTEPFLQRVSYRLKI